jgi:hypothetical protein
MVAKQEKIAAQPNSHVRLVSKQYKEQNTHYFLNELRKRENHDQHGDNLRRQRTADR